MSIRAWTFLFVAVTFGAYLLIAWLSRVRDTKGFYVAGRGSDNVFRIGPGVPVMGNHDYTWHDLGNNGTRKMTGIIQLSDEAYERGTVSDADIETWQWAMQSTSNDKTIASGGDFRTALSGSSSSCAIVP